MESQLTVNDDKKRECDVLKRDMNVLIKDNERLVSLNDVHLKEIITYKNDNECLRVERDRLDH